MERSFVPDGFELIAHSTFTEYNSVVITRVRQESLTREVEEEETEDETAPIIDEDGYTLDCAVCLTELSNPITIVDCTHYFCYVCISTWLKKKISCPLCKTVVSAFVSSSADKSIQFWKVGNNNEKRFSLAKLNHAINCHNKKTFD